MLDQAIHDFLSNLTTFIYNIYYCADFLIFLIVSKAFRHQLKRIIYKIIGKDLIPIREEENRQEHIERNHVGINVVNVDVLPA
jgi:hypothetical protein